MRRSLAARMLVAGAVVALVVAGAFSVLLGAIAELRSSSDSARRSAEVIGVANRSEKLVLDVETGARGFVITGRNEFLEPWAQGRRQLPVELDRLAKLVSDNPQQEVAALAIRQGARDYLRRWSEPLVALARRSPSRAMTRVAIGGGKRRVDAMRRQFDGFVHAESGLSEARTAHANGAARNAVAAGVAGLTVSVVLILLFTGYLTRVVMLPVRAVAEAARRLAAGELGARVPVRGRDEIGRLGEAFNAMSTSLEASRDELESQNVELEMQTVALEDNQQELATANDELRAQRDELERATAQLAEEKELLDAYNTFSERLARETEVSGVADLVLRTIADTLGAAVGTLYGTGSDVEDSWLLVCSRGLDPARLPAALPRAEGLPARAVAERRPILTSHGAGGLTLIAFGQEVAIRDEMHVPLLHGDRALGVIALGGTAAGGIGDRQRDAVERLADLGAVALANAYALAEVRRLADINRAVLDSVRDAVTLIDRDERIVLANAQARRLARALLPARFHDAAELAHAIAPRTTDPGAFLAVSDRTAADPERESFDEFQLADSGRWFERYSGPVPGAAGTVGRIMVIREVTRKREAEQAKNDVMAAVSHELRTPLASVLGFAELLLSRNLEADERTRSLEVIHREATRLSDLIHDFLDLQRMEHEGLDPGTETFSLDELLHEQVELFSAQSTRHRIHLETPGAPLVVRGDPAAIARVAANLLSNSIKYAPAGGTVTVTARRSTRSIMVSVIDEGIGIPANQRSQIFEKFFRVDSSDTREIGGTGLGLALAREIVHAHGGEVGFDSIERRGSTFWFTLPNPQHAGT